MKKTAIALLAVTASTMTLAQGNAEQPYARITDLEGLVTVTTGNQLSNAAKNMALPKGAQVLSTGNGVATIQFANGCKVTLRAGESLMVEENECAAFLAKGGGAPATAFSARNVALGIGGAALLYDATRSRGRQPTIVLPEVPPTVTPPVVPPVITPPISGS